MVSDKEKAQLYATLIISVGMVIIALSLVISLIIVETLGVAVTGPLHDSTLLVIGGIVAQASAAATWLYSKNGTPK